MNPRRWLAAAAFVAMGVITAGCTQPVAEAAGPVIHIEEAGDGPAEITLVSKAADRLGVATGEVTSGSDGLVVPYDAVVYDASGGAWAYVEKAPLVYERAPLEIVEVDDEEAFVSSGPPAGTRVVTTGAAELYGAETGVGGGH
jgi:hypothetical protein